MSEEMRDGFSEAGGDLPLPDSLRAELRGLYAAKAGIPASRDADILRLARARHENGGRSRWRGWPLRGAVAAGLVAAMTLGICWQQKKSAGSAYVRTGDIRDAFYVARELKAHAPLANQWDENHDGVISDSDVRALAMAAVRVNVTGEGR